MVSWLYKRPKAMVFVDTDSIVSDMADGNETFSMTGEIGDGFFTDGMALGKYLREGLANVFS